MSASTVRRRFGRERIERRNGKKVTFPDCKKHVPSRLVNTIKELKVSALLRFGPGRALRPSRRRDGKWRSFLSFNPLRARVTGMWQCRAAEAVYYVHLLMRASDTDSALGFPSCTAVPDTRIHTDDAEVLRSPSLASGFWNTN